MRFFASVSVAGALLVLLAVGSLSGSLPANLVIFSTSGLHTGQLPQGWQLKVNRGTPDISIVPGPSGTAIRLKSERASFSLERAVDIDLDQYPVLSWTWKVTQLPEGADFRHSRLDDQAAQVLIAFSNRNVISYIWDSTAPRGAIESISLFPLVRVTAVVCRSGPAEANRWLSESRDVASDFEAAYGKRAGRIKGIRLQINSQHTGTSAESYFGEVAFLEKPR